MSFFARLGSDSDSDSGSESEESILSGDEGEKQDATFASKPKGKASQFLRSDGDDSSDEEESDEDDSDDEDVKKPVRRANWISWSTLTSRRAKLLNS